MGYDADSPSPARPHILAILLACLLGAASDLAGSAQASQKSVLVLITTRRDAPASAVLDRTIRTVLYENLGERLDYHTEYLDLARFHAPDYQSVVRDFLRRKYASLTFDVVVATTDDMVAFADAHRDELFPGAALVFNSSKPSSGPNSTGVLTGIDLKGTIDVAIQLHPDLRHVFLVSGVSEADRYYQNLARAQLRAFEGRLDFTYLSGQTLPDLLRRVAVLPQDAVVYFLSFFEDGGGGKFIPFEAFERVAAATNVPIYHWSDLGMGHGMVGGDVLSVELMSRAVANVALRVLKGESPDSIPVREIDANVAQFDWRQLRRWGISEARLPADSLVAFRVPTLWDQYKIQIVAAASLLVLQTLLIAGLLVQGARRRRVETALRKSNLENQDLAGRLITAQEAERARIARDLHDDANQQLTGMSIVLGGVRRRLSEDGDSGEVDETLAMLQQRADTLSDSLRNLSHELHSGSLQYVGLVAALEEHCAEFARHHQIDVRVQASDGIGSLQPDIALCLYRVVQEALNNTSRHAHAGAVQIRVARTAEGVELEVIDDGIGFEPDRRNGTGLGLRSIGERVRFAKGQVTVDSRPGHGTKLFVQIPVADVANAELASS